MTESPDGPADGLTAISNSKVARMSDMLTILDEFLRSNSVAGLLSAHLSAHGYGHPG